VIRSSVSDSLRESDESTVELNLRGKGEEGRRTRSSELRDELKKRRGEGWTHLLEMVIVDLDEGIGSLEYLDDPDGGDDLFEEAGGFSLRSCHSL